MKKSLTLIGIIAALSMFLPPVIASADDDGWEKENFHGTADHDGWKNFHGTYQMSASGSCLHSSLEYFQNAQRNNWWTAPDGSQVYAGVTVANGSWTFESTGKRTGKGTYSQTIYATILPGGADSFLVGGTNLPVPVEVRVLASKDVAFTYEITPSGDITVTETASGIKLYGSISIDKNTMTLLSANNVQHFGGLFGWTICNFARTLIKVDE